MPKYIDADALKNELIECTPYAVDPVYRNTNSNIDMFTVMEMLDGQPTADVVPVVRGEWVLVGTNEHDYETSVEEKCSLCGRYVYRYDTQPQDNYCPNCGADMRGSEVKE